MSSWFAKNKTLLDQL